MNEGTPSPATGIACSFCYTWFLRAVSPQDKTLEAKIPDKGCTIIPQGLAVSIPEQAVCISTPVIPILTVRGREINKLHKYVILRFEKPKGNHGRPLEARYERQKEAYATYRVYIVTPEEDDKRAPRRYLAFVPPAKDDPLRRKI